MATVQLPLFAPPVTLKISFEDLFGTKQIDMDDDARRLRWAQWLRKARKRPQTRDIANVWTDSEGCHEGGRCFHLRGRCWCAMSSLPASVNPILSFRRGMVGMACMGAGHTMDGKTSTRTNEAFFESEA